MSTIWAVTGAKFTADSARMETFKSTNGARGVTLPGDLKVTALPTPGAFVRVNAGGATLPASQVAAPGQSYGVYFNTATDVPVPATTSSGGAVRWLFLRIMDPQFEGPVPADPINHEYAYFEWRSSNAPVVGPYTILAYVTMPASTATITSGMITDYRQMAKRRIWTDVYSSNNGASTTLSSNTGMRWPLVAPSYIVPDWANWYHMIVHISGYKQLSPLADAQLWPRIGGVPNNGNALMLDHDLFYDGVRYSASASAQGLVPAGYAGTLQVFDVWAVRVAPGTQTGFLAADASTHVTFQIQFEERII